MISKTVNSSFSRTLPPDRDRIICPIVTGPKKAYKSTSEIIEADVRAKRSMRVFEHQEGRIKTLEDEIKEKSTLLEEVKQQYAELVKVHDYTKEVQSLQQQLIRLQELEFISHLTTSKNSSTLVKFPADSSAYTRLTESSTTPSGISLPDCDYTNPTVLEKLIASKKKSEVLHLTPLEQMSYEKGQLLNAIKHKLSELEVGLNLDNQSQNLKNATKELRQDSEGNFQDEEEFEISRDVSSKAEGNDINALRDRLTSHKRAISSLSNEVLVLRQEREELLSYMKNVLVSRTPPDTILKEADTYSGRLREDFQMRLENEAGKSISNNNNSNCNTDQGPSSRKSGFGVKHGGASSSEDDERATKNFSRKGSQLEVRANRLWDTACKFFTPEQAHFILTTPIPSNKSDSEDDPEI